MRHFKRIMAAMVMAAMILASGGIAAAAAFSDVVGTRYEDAVGVLSTLGIMQGFPDGTFHPAEPITRAQFCKVAVTAMGKGDLADLLRGGPSFGDVPATHWASGHIVLAKNMGIMGGYPDGTFRPDQPATYVEVCKVLLEAAGVPPTAGLTWPANYLDAAQRTGMLDGIPGFQAGLPAPRGDCALMTAFVIQNVKNPETGLTLVQSVFGAIVAVELTLTPASALVGIGEAVQFAAVAKDDEGNLLSDVDFDWSTNVPTKSAVSSSGLFVATAAGTYTVTVEAGLTATATVVVYGEAEGLKATASRTTVPANGETVVEITVEVVDENGNRVADADDEIAMGHDEDNGAVTLGDTPLDAEDGVAVFEVTATDSPEVTDTLIFTSGVGDDALDEATVEITTAEQVATAIGVEADRDELMANEEDETDVTATVLDQGGEDMLFGVYELSFSIHGPGLLEGGTDDVDAVTTGQQATLPVSSEKGDPGTFTVTVTGEGLASGSVDVTTYIAGLPKALEVTVGDGTGEAGDTDDMKFTVTIVDKFGHPTISDDDVTVNFEANDDDAVFFGLGPLTIFSGDSRDTVEFHGQTAGTFTIEAADANGLADDSFQVTVTPGAATHLGLTPHLDDCDLLLHISNPKAVFTAELQDEFDNRVPKAGVDLLFKAYEGANSGDATFSPDDEVETDSTGKATVTLVAQPYVGDSYEVAVGGAGLTGDGTTGLVVITDVMPDALAITTKNEGGQAISRIPADAEEWVVVTVQLKDTNGNLVGDGFLIDVEFSNDGKNVQNVSDVIDGLLDNDMTVITAGEAFEFETVDGVVDFAFEGAKAGSFTIKATAPEVLGATKSKSFTTVVGTEAVDVEVFTNTGGSAKEMDYDAEEVLPLRVSLVDHGGNPIAIEEDTEVYAVPANMTDGSEYRLTQTGTAVWDFEILAGKTYRTVYYIDDAEGVDEDLSDDIGPNMLVFVDLDSDFDNADPEVWVGVHYEHEVFRLVYNRGVDGQILIEVEDTATGEDYIDWGWLVRAAGQNKAFEWSYRDENPCLPSEAEIWASDNTIVPTGSITWRITLQGDDDATYVISGTHQMTEEDVRNADHLDFNGVRAATVNEDPANPGQIADTLVVTTINHVFAADIDEGDVTVNNLPAGLDYTVTRTDETTLTIAFTGTATSHANSNDVDDASVTISGDKITYGGVALDRDLTTEDFVIDFDD